MATSSKQWKRPWWVTVSPSRIWDMISRRSSETRPRYRMSSPITSNSLGLAPMPTPKRSLPLESTSTDRADFES